MSYRGRLCMTCGNSGYPTSSLTIIITKADFHRQLLLPIRPHGDACPQHLPPRRHLQSVFRPYLPSRHRRRSRRFNQCPARCCPRRPHLSLLPCSPIPPRLHSAVYRLGTRTDRRPRYATPQLPQKSKHWHPLRSVLPARRR